MLDMNRQPLSSRINRDSPSRSWERKKWVGGVGGTLPDLLAAHSLTYLWLNKPPTQHSKRSESTNTVFFLKDGICKCGFWRPEHTDEQTSRQWW